MKQPYAAKPSYVPTIETAPGASGTETAERSGSSYASQKRWSGRGGDEWRFRCSARPLCPRFHCAVGEKPLFQRFIGELRTQGPRGARFGRSFEVVLDRAARRPPSVRPISRALTASGCSRSAYRNCRMVGLFLAGIPSSASTDGGGCLSG
jgi:hypothetical protein